MSRDLLMMSNRELIYFLIEMMILQSTSVLMTSQNFVFLDLDKK